MSDTTVDKAKESLSTVDEDHPSSLFWEDDDSFVTCGDNDGDERESPRSEKEAPRSIRRGLTVSLSQDPDYIDSASLDEKSGAKEDSFRFDREERDELLTKKNGGGDEEEEDWDNDLPLDSFSMLYVAKWRKGDVATSLYEHCFPICVFSVQILIMVLLMINLLEDSDRQIVTVLNVPVDAPLTVKLSQYVAVMVSVFTADDLVTGTLNVGRRVVKKARVRDSMAPCPTSSESPEQVQNFRRSISRAFRHTRNQWKWEVANAMRIVEGALVIVVSFIFILQSATAIDLWLNFAAVQFVGMLDDTAYHLAKNRFLGAKAKRLAGRVDDYEIYSEGDKRRKILRGVRIALFSGICLVGWALLSVLIYNQEHSKFACHSITVTVGETRHWKARYFSGRYIIQDDKINDRAVYVQEQGNGSFLAYCNEEGLNRWTLSPLKKDEIPRDPCGKFVLQSFRTRTHDISEIGSDIMFKNGDEADAHIKCNHCYEKHGGGGCSFRGTCGADSRLCECDPGFFGDSCQFSGPCTELGMHDEFHGFYSRAYQKNWDLMYLNGSPVMVYERPVYVQNTDGEIIDVILYDGGRWLVSQTDYFYSWFNTYSGQESAYFSFAKYLATFNARDDEFIASYITAEPSTLGSPINLPFRAWITEAAEDSIGKLGDEEYELLCADCDTGEEDEGLSTVGICTGTWGEPDFDLCKVTENDNHGVVNRCDCYPGFAGPLCHLRPIEGTSSLHLDHATGMCSTCYEDNIWQVWDINEMNLPCFSMGTLFFEDENNLPFSRQLGLHLNATHFSVFVSSKDDTLETLCLAKEGAEEVYAIRRDITEERIFVNVAIHLDNRKDFLGEVVKPKEVDCPASTEIDHDVCSLSLAEVYSTSDMRSSLVHAWLLLDLKITPNLGGDRGDDEPDEPSLNFESAVTSLEVSPTTAGKAIEIESSNASSNPAENIATPEAPPTNSSTNEAISPQLDEAVATPWSETQAHSMFSFHEASTATSAVSQEYKFAVIPKYTESIFYLEVQAGCEERAASLSRQSVRGSVSIKCIFVGPTDTVVTEQTKIAMDLINSGTVDGISIAVLDEGAASEVIDSAVAANIPIVTFDSDAPSSKRAAYVGTDNLALGEELGMLLMTRFATSGKYAIISDINPNLLIRERGIRNILGKNSWQEVPGSPIEDGEDGHNGHKTIELMHDLMAKQPDINAMIVTYGVPMWVGDGSWERFVQQYPNLLIFSADSMPEQLDLMNRGFVNGLVGQQPAEMGSKSIDTLLALSKGNAVDDFIPTSMVVMGRVNNDNPYTRYEPSSVAARRTGIVTSFLLTLLTMAITVNSLLII